jgi:hypothetical protein
MTSFIIILTTILKGCFDLLRDELAARRAKRTEREKKALFVEEDGS